MLIVTVRLSTGVHRLPDDFRRRRKRTPNTYNDMKPEKFRQLSLQKNAGTMAPACFFLFCCFRRFYAPSSREAEAPAFGQAAAFYADGGDFAFFSRFRRGEEVFG